MKVYSECTRTMIDQAEALYRAANNDVVEFVVADYTDEIRAAGYAARLMEYHLYRLATPATAAEWDAFAGAGAEAGYIHHGGVRRQIPSSGWYVMNLGNVPYVDWQHANAIKLAKGLRYGAPQFTYPPPTAGILMDLTLWYPAFDSGQENITTSDEYGAAPPDTYQILCRLAYLGMQAALDGEFGADVVRAYPNFGNLLFAGEPDANTAAVIAGSKLVLVEEALHWTSGKTNLKSADIENRWSLMASLLVGSRELMLDAWVLDSESQSNKDAAKIGAASFAMIGYATGIACKFYFSPEDQAEHISTWEQNELYARAYELLGNPISARETIAGAWTQGVLYHRAFDGGHVYFYPQKTGQNGYDFADVSFADPVVSMQPDGSLGMFLMSASIGVGQGLIVVPAIIQASGRGEAPYEGLLGESTEHVASGSVA